MLIFRSPIKEGGYKQGLATCPCSRTQIVLLHSVFALISCTFNVSRNGFDSQSCKKGVTVGTKRQKFAGDDSSSDVAIKSLRWDGMDCAWAAPNLLSSELVDTWMPRQNVTGSDVPGGADGEVYKRYVEEEYCSSAVLASILLARGAALDWTRLADDCDWDKLDVLDYVTQNWYLDYHRFSIFPVEGQIGWAVTNGKSEVTMYGTFCMGVALRVKQAVLRV